MTPGFVLLALLTIAGAAAAMALRNLVHCALSIAMSFAGLASIYLQLNAEFVGFAQLLVYVGAVAVLIVFAILLTRLPDARPGSNLNPPILSHGWVPGVVIASAVFLLLAGATMNSPLSRATALPVEPTVRNNGEQLMSRYILPLQVAGLLLTAALLGAVVLAMHQSRRITRDSQHTLPAGGPPQ